MIRKPFRLAGHALSFLLVCGLARAQQPLPDAAQGTDLASLNIEDLMNITVTSVAAKAQTLSRTASAVFVISQTDIQRSGATNIPDVLRMAPGLDVAQIDANSWAVSARGLSDEFGNELLVLLDGRNVYTQTFGGVLWDLLDLPLEDIERIEVIRGPGGTIWGANAVNGVVNIITKKTSETRGGMVVAGGGNTDHGFGTAQYGGSLGKSTDFRVYSKYFNQDHLIDVTGQNGEDGWHILRGGFRTDSALSTKDSLMIQGDIFTGREGSRVASLPSVTAPGLINVVAHSGESGGFLQSVWQHDFSARSDTVLGVSYGAYRADNILNSLDEGRNTVAIDFQNHFAWGDRQSFVWGLSYQYSSSHSSGTLTVSLNPANLNTQVFGSFLQDEIALISDRVYLTVGAKLEHNYYTGFGFMPSARLTFSPSRRQMFWIAVSRAERTPASSDTAIRANFGSSPGPGGTPILASLIGNPKFQNEGLIAYELGYRASITSELSVDIAGYYSAYDHQQTSEPAADFLEATPAPVHIVTPFTYENLMHGEAHGLEIAANWKLTDRWTLSPGYDFERFHMHLDPGSLDTQTVDDVEGTDPHMHAQLRSHVELSSTLAWNVSAYFVDRLAFQDVPAYARLDTGLTWSGGEGFSLSLVGQNLLQNQHLEFDQEGTVSTLVKRSGYAKITWRF